MSIRRLSLAALALILLGTMPGAAQERNQLKDIFDKAQQERDKKAVDDLIKRLERPGTPPAAPPAPPPPPVAAPAPPLTPAPTPPIAAPAPPITPTPPPVAMPAPPPTPEPGKGGNVPAPAPTSPTPPPPIAAPQPPVTPPPVATPAPPAAVPPPPVEKAPEMARRNEVPSIDIEVYFDFGKADITPQGAETLRVLGQALADPRLAGSRFIIAGHTDSKGSVAVNRAVSQARADAVRRWLIQTFKVPPQNLIARGFGSTQPKDPANPQADQNRRVQVINWTGQTPPPTPAPAARPKKRR